MSNSLVWPDSKKYMSVPSTLVDLFSSLRQRFSGRLDSEHEQAFIRLIIGIFVFFYFSLFSLVSNLYGPHRYVSFVWVMVVFIAASIMLIAHIATYPRIFPLRRLLSIILDVGTVTYFFFNADEHGLPLYFFYLWIIFGYGFRFGKRYLLFTLALSILGFGAAIFTLPYWANNRFLGSGLWVGMLLISLYVNTLVGRLTKALERAEEANQAKRHFISSVSHELRTPLNAIIGMADLLHSTALTSEQEDMVNSMDNASHVMLSLIEDVLDFSKIEAGKLIIENTDFDLHQLINSTVDIFKHQASERGLSLMTYIDPGIPYALRGDPHHLRQVLVNLLSNAIKFTKKGRVVLRIDSLIDTEHVVQLRFGVEDTGIGISMEAQAKVFDSFTQADESTSRRYGGTGLGTTISKQLVELMGGQLGLQSELGVGSVFWFELELKKQLTAIDQQLFAGLNVLLIGFDKAEAPHITETLEDWDISYLLVDDIDLAIGKLQNATRLDNLYRIVLISGTSVKNARLTGQSQGIFLQQSIKELRRNAGQDITVILCGADSLRGQTGRQIAEDAGLSAVLNFPIEKRLLLNAIHAGKSVISVTPAVVSLAGYHQNKETQDIQYSILVAEDNPTNSKVIQKILQRAGHRCVLVQNGEEALDQLGQQDFDAVVFDMNMPVMNGLEATKAYRFMWPADMRAPIIMFSANVTTEAKEECMRAGVDEFLPKPIQVTSFLETLNRLVKKFGGVQRSRLPYRPLSGVPILAQSSGDEIILNYATLAELEHIGQDRAFVDGLLIGFIQDNQTLVEKLEEPLLLLRFEEFKEILHAIKGSAVSIGALSLRATCQRFEKMTHNELKRDTQEIPKIVKSAFNQLCAAIDCYRKQRDQSTSQKH
ncbi:MAG: histidine kinase [Herminiimonas sp.]|nr:histidine kinase [Herminiimonas sp.]